MQRGTILGEGGDLEGAVAAMSEAVSLADKLDGKMEVQPVAIMMRQLTVQHVAPDWHELAAGMDRVVERSEPALWEIVFEAFAAYAHARDRAPDVAARMLAGVIPTLAVRRPADYAQPLAVGLAAAAAWELRSAPLAEELRPPALGLVREDIEDMYMISNALTVARLATLTERGVEALEYFSRARERLAARGQRPLGAIVDHDEGIARRLLHEPGASSLLTSAKERFAELGMHDWLLRLADEVTPSTYPDDLTPREVEVLRVLSSGSTNNEIAAQLFLSVHTVERHLTNAYRKVGVRNRTDATAYVIRTGL
jgi:DNA-binding CsgD family transcriptional regulator